MYYFHIAMMPTYALTLSIAVLFGVQMTYARRGGFRGMFPDKYPPMLQNGVDPGEPLFLTPYAEKGQFDMGKFQSYILLIFLCSICEKKT
jgi:hypothetical protein